MAKIVITKRKRDKEKKGYTPALGDKHALVENIEPTHTHMHLGVINVWFWCVFAAFLFSPSLNLPGLGPC